MVLAEPLPAVSVITRVLLASEDRDLFTLLTMVFRSVPDIVVSGRVSTGGELLACLDDTPIDVVLIDLDAPGAAVLSAASIAASFGARSIRFIGLTSSSEAERAVAGGLDGLMGKEEPLAQLAACLRGESGAQGTATGRDLLPFPPRDEIPSVPARAAAFDAESKPVHLEPAIETTPVGGVVNDETKRYVDAVQFGNVKEPVAEGPSNIPVPERESSGVGAPAGWAPLAFGSTALTVAPFSSFRALAAFQQALAGLPGVRSVKTRRFHRGTLYAVVQYEGDAPLADRVLELTEFEPTIVSNVPGSVEVRISSAEPLAPEASTPA